MTIEENLRTLQLNLIAPVALFHAALDGMLRRGRGHIVNISAMAGRVSFPYTEVYAAAKDGLIGFTRVRPEPGGRGKHHHAEDHRAAGGENRCRGVTITVSRGELPPLIATSPAEPAPAAQLLLDARLSSQGGPRPVARPVGPGLIAGEEAACQINLIILLYRRIPRLAVGSGMTRPGKERREMNEACDRCGPAVRAAYRVERHGELYLCRHCASQQWAALCAQGWTIWPVGALAVAPQANEFSGAS